MVETKIPGVYESGVGNVRIKSGGTTTGLLKGLFGSATTAPTEATPAAPSNEDQVKTTLADLKNQYQTNLQGGYDYAANKLKAERDADLREQYIANRQEETALPEKLARYGINGGATETTLADLKARYQNGRNATRQNYLTNLADLGQNYMTQNADAARSYDDRWLDYLLDKAETENRLKLQKAYA